MPTSIHPDIRVLIDPEMSDPLTGGGRLQDVSVTHTDRDVHAARPVGSL